MKTIKTLPIMLISAFVLLTACKKDDIEKEEKAEPQEFKVSMTDAPGDYESLEVEIESVEIYNENSGWIMLTNETQFVSVLDLTNGQELELGTVQNVDAGIYTRVKLNFGDEHKLKLTSSVDIEIGDIILSSEILVDLGFEGSKEVEIAINQEVSATSGVDLLIDFNVAQSIIKDGEEYILRPVITEIKDRSTGVNGNIEGSAGAALLLTNGSDTLSSYTNAEGKFLIRGMEPGTYDLIAYPESETGEVLLEEERINGIVITRGEMESAGTIEF